MTEPTPEKTNHVEVEDQTKQSIANLIKKIEEEKHQEYLKTFFSKIFNFLETDKEENDFRKFILESGEPIQEIHHSLPKESNERHFLKEMTSLIMMIDTNTSNNRNEQKKDEYNFSKNKILNKLKKEVEKLKS